MFRNMNQVDIDVHKFKAWLSRNKLAITSVSEELGHGKSYLSSCLGRRKLPLAEAKLLGVLYGLSIDDILPDPPPGGSTDRVEFRPTNRRGSNQARNHTRWGDCWCELCLS